MPTARSRPFANCWIALISTACWCRPMRCMTTSLFLYIEQRDAVAL
jgi:hypothetical protein